MALWRHFLALAACAALAPVARCEVAAPLAGGPPARASYADLADLADAARVVARARVRQLARVEDARAPGLRARHGRFYIEAATVALLTGDAPLGRTLRFLADLPLDPRGKPPPLRKKDVLVFARAVPNRPDELALVAPDALYAWDAALDARARAVIAALLAPGAPARVTGVRELAYVPGDLAGAGETQVFLATADGSAASLSIVHRPGEPPRWGASFSELTADVARPPARDTLAWYRLACFLPPDPPAGADRSQTADARARALADYRAVIAGLGACERLRGG